MIIEIKVPTPGESITEVEITNWMVKEGDLVIKNQDLAEIESDKATLSLVASESGKVINLVKAGTTIAVNSVACQIDTTFAQEADSKAPVSSLKAATSAKTEKVTIEETKKVEPVQKSDSAEKDDHVKVSPLAQQLMDEHNLSVDDILNGLRRLSSKDVKAVIDSGILNNGTSKRASAVRTTSRQKMTQLRKKLSQRLVAVKNETAMLTTFNEADMSVLMDLRNKQQKAFTDTHGIKLGFMSFFLKAAAVAMLEHPMVNSMIDGDEIVIPDYVDISVAVQTPKGLMVPVIRNVESLSLAQIELKLKELADKARNGQISMEEMTGGTFTITNGGVFGSMLSTPIINPPQSAILGMHNIVDRPVAVNGQVLIRPVMYIALSYDHRLIDGKDSVGFLKKVKELIENPLQMLANGQDAEKLILGL